jgi:hypothetical protein
MAVFGRAFPVDAWRSGTRNTGSCLKAVGAKTALGRRLAVLASTRQALRSGFILVSKLGSSWFVASGQPVRSWGRSGRPPHPLCVGAGCRRRHGELVTTGISGSQRGSSSSLLTKTRDARWDAETEKGSREVGSIRPSGKQRRQLALDITGGVLLYGTRRMRYSTCNFHAANMELHMKNSH